MKKILLYISAFALSVAGLSSCADDYDEYDNSWLLDNDETMTLSSSATSLELVEETPVDEKVLTFRWTPAREMSDEYVLTYITYLDLKVNNFAASTRVREIVDESEHWLADEGVFEWSYTTEELQDYITEKWVQSTSEVATLSFKVIASWEGGSKYVMPEVRSVDIDIQPYRPNVFEADRVNLDGDAVRQIRPSMNYTMSTTPENEFIYAGEFEMAAGIMNIPIEQSGATLYICPDDGETIDVPDADLVDGKPAPTEAYKVKVMDIPDSGKADELPAWNLPSAGYWRVIIDMENETVQFYSPKNRLESATVQFYYEGNESGWLLEKTLTTGTYYVNTMTGWDNWKGKAYAFQASQIDPQLLIWDGQGSTIDVSDKFCIKIGQSLEEGFAVLSSPDGARDPNGDAGMQFVSKTFAFAPVPNPEWVDDGVDGNDNDAELELGTWMEMRQIVTNGKWHPEGTAKISKIQIDIRNSRIRFN